MNKIVNNINIFVTVPGILLINAYKIYSVRNKNQLFCVNGRYLVRRGLNFTYHLYYKYILTITYLPFHSNSNPGSESTLSVRSRSNYRIYEHKFN